MAKRLITSKKEQTPFKIKKCNVISYHKNDKALDVDFDGFGIRIKNVENFSDTTASIKYKGEIGKPGFVYGLE